MLTEQERKIAEFGKNNGKSRQEVEQAILKYRSEQETTQSTTTPVTTENTAPITNKITNALGLGGATKTFGDVLARAGVGGQNEGQRRVSELTGMSQEQINKANIEAPTKGQVAGAVLQTAAIPAGFALTGGTSLLGQAATGAGIGYAYDIGQDLINKKSAQEVVTPGMGTLVGAAAPAVIKGASAGVGALKGKATQVASDVGNKVSEALPESSTIQGVKQTVSDVAERVPRFVGKVKDTVQEQAVKAERIRNAPPVVAQALKVDLPEQFIDPVLNADPATKQAFKRVLDVADTPKTTLGQKANPSIVAGDLATKQFDVIENQRKTIGDALNKATAQLSKTEPVQMKQAYNQLDSILSEQGITPVYGTRGVELDFSKSKLAPKQRQVIKDLYKLATEGGDTLTPTEIHRKDQLFSALQREARADQIEDILIDLPDGQKMSMFRAFRDVYANQLDTLSPEIKDLNRKYRNIMTLIEDVENSIFKTPDFNVTKSTDPAEFAKVNLRRIFGEAQSSPVYEAIADEMDAVSRQLGYADASPKEVAAFAQEIRALYPETIPKTGFQGGIRGAFSDIAGRVLEAGKADTTDQRKALRALIETSGQAQIK